MPVPQSRNITALYSRIVFGVYGVYATAAGAKGLYSGSMPRVVASVLAVSGCAMLWVATRRRRRRKSPPPTSRPPGD
jgi:hypothetical protein